MTAWLRQRPALLNLIVVGFTVLIVAVTLVVGRAQAEPPLDLRVGEEAPRTFYAVQYIELEDEEATERARERAYLNREAIYRIDMSVTNRVFEHITRFFSEVQTGAFPEDADISQLPGATQVPETTTTTEPPPSTTEAEDGGATAGDEETTTTTTTTLPPTTTTTTIARIAIEDQVVALGEEPRFRLYGDAIPVFVELYDQHLDELVAGGTGFWDRVEDEVVEVARQQLNAGIRQSEIQQVRSELVATPPFVRVPGLTASQQEALQHATGLLVSQALEANEDVDARATEDARQAARDAVSPVMEQFAASQPIVGAGEEMTQLQLDAINQLRLNLPAPGSSRIASAFLGGIAVLLAALFLWRTAPGQWSQPKHMAVLGVLLIVAALVSRVPELLAMDNSQLAYLIPASMLGYAAAIMYEPRTALLTAVPMGIFTAISTQHFAAIAAQDLAANPPRDIALTVFAVAATVAPVAFVSAVSTRRQLRVAVILTALVLAPLGGAVSWMFDGRQAALGAAAAALAGGLIAGFLAQGLVSSLENLFRVTTTVTLLDLVDRNHPALRLIEERAPGTFNHSILVGNLAGKAARAIGADPLLAQAAAFYHDLGKTEHPQYFIENQFGVSNPHNELRPEESAEIIRRHVADGLRLAQQYRIPSDVADGIQQHHGTGLMRYFYHTAMETDPGVDPAAFRHQGIRPQRKEMAILMISDAVEGAARSLAQQEDPTADSLRKVVDSVVGEKLDDGQLDEAALTFGDLTTVKRALVEALVGYYHTRIPYPGFPGPPVETPA